MSDPIECPNCGEDEMGCDCEAPCSDCGADLAAGEMHDDLCCAGGLSRFDLEEMRDDEIRERMRDEEQDE